MRPEDGKYLDRNELIRFALNRLAFHKDVASEVDYPRIEELSYLLLAVMQSDNYQDALARMAVVGLDEKLREASRLASKKVSE